MGECCQPGCAALAVGAWREGILGKEVTWRNCLRRRRSERSVILVIWRSAVLSPCRRISVVWPRWVGRCPKALATHWQHWPCWMRLALRRQLLRQAGAILAL